MRSNSEQKKLPLSLSFLNSLASHRNQVLRMSRVDQGTGLRHRVVWLSAAEGKEQAQGIAGEPQL